MMAQAMPIIKATVERAEAAGDEGRSNL